MKRKTIVIIVIALVVICGVGAVVASGGAGIYFLTQGINPLVVTPSATTTNAQPIRSELQAPTQPHQQPVEMATSASETTQPITSEIDGMNLLVVPAGDFQMGATEAQYQAALTLCEKYGDSQADCQKWTVVEKPVHTVYLDAFQIDQTLVTNTMYTKCVKAGGCQAPSDSSSATQKNYYDDSQYADYPVVFVNWNDADAYCRWAGRSLPTEAQWEKAARGKDGRIFPWGNQEPGSSLANNYDLKGDTTRVGSYPAGASPYRALDMAGNVDEWVADWYGPTYYANSPDRNPTGPDSGTMRVLRGGAWAINDYGIRSSNRDHLDPATQNMYIGFRCAVTPSHTITNLPRSRPTEEAAIVPTQETAATLVPQPDTTQPVQTEAPTYFKVFFQNDCDKAAEFAIHYLNLDDQWITEGWWKLQPGEFAYVANTMNTIYYYYGELLDYSPMWGGGDLNLNVDSSTESFGFGEFKITNADYGEALNTFTCP